MHGYFKGIVLPKLAHNVMLSQLWLCQHWRSNMTILRFYVHKGFYPFNADCGHTIEEKSRTACAKSFNSNNAVFNCVTENMKLTSHFESMSVKHHQLTVCFLKIGVQP